MLTIWWDSAADGPTNMAADECLAAEAERRDSLLMRFYDWSTTTISLGGFQKLEDARHVDEIGGIPLVRRPSGGGAIVHGSDLTYAAAVPKSHPWGASPQILYDALHGAMVETLAEHGVRAWLWPAGGVAPPRADAAVGHLAASEADVAGFFCFDRRAAGDLVMAGPAEGGFTKIMGSAQRRLAGVVLQHGSLLLQSNAGLTGAARHLGVADLIVEQPVSEPLPERAGLSRAWVRRLAHSLGGSFQEEAAFSSAHQQEIATVAARFREDRWMARR
jgi:lipoate-protein ligase A